MDFESEWPPKGSLLKKRPPAEDSTPRPGVLLFDALKLRPTGLGSGIDKDRPDYTVYCGE